MKLYARFFWFCIIGGPDGLMHILACLAALWMWGVLTGGVMFWATLFAFGFMSPLIMAKFFTSPDDAPGDGLAIRSEREVSLLTRAMIVNVFLVSLILAQWCCFQSSGEFFARFCFQLKWSSISLSSGFLMSRLMVMNEAYQERRAKQRKAAPAPIPLPRAMPAPMPQMARQVATSVAA